VRSTAVNCPARGMDRTVIDLSKTMIAGRERSPAIRGRTAALGHYRSDAERSGLHASDQNAADYADRARRKV
jgi:hypothetical protein